jgi:hypothetical protein
MFDLEQSIAGWRRQMLDAGIQTPVPLEELESHLRENVENQMQAGLSTQQAFETTVRQIGRGEMLQPEFARAGETIYEQLKRLFCAFAGIPNYQLATNMNTSSQNIEPGWATYLKSAALIVPAIFIWVGSCVFVVPKLKEICYEAGTHIPEPVLAALVISDFVKNNFILEALALLAALVWLEWRSRRWPQYRRLVFGIAAYSLNLIALILITTMMVFAVIAAANLLHHAK